MQKNVGNDVPGNGGNAGHVVKNAGNVYFANLVAENDGQVLETAENVNVRNVAIQGQNIVNVVANEVVLGHV